MSRRTILYKGMVKQLHRTKHEETSIFSLGRILSFTPPGSHPTNHKSNLAGQIKKIKVLHIIYICCEDERSLACMHKTKINIQTYTYCNMWLSNCSLWSPNLAKVTKCLLMNRLRTNLTPSSRAP